MLAAALILALAACVSAAQAAWADDSALSAGGMPELGVQAKKDYVSPDGLVRVYDIKSGEVKYDQKTKTLTLNKLKARAVEFYGDSSFKLVLVGASSAKVHDGDYSLHKGDEEVKFIERKASVTVSGKGKLSGIVDIKGDLTVRSGQIGTTKYKAKDNNAAIECGKLTVNGGKVVLDACRGFGIKCTGLKLGKGLIKVHDQRVNLAPSAAGISIRDGNLNVSGGKLAVTVFYGNAIYVSGHMIDDVADLDGGTAVARRGGNALVTGGSIALSARKRDQYVCGLECSGNLTVKGGFVSAYAKKDCKKDGREQACGVSCGTLKVSGGTVTASAYCAGNSNLNLAAGVRCSGLVISKGSLSASATGKRRACSEGVSCRDGVVKVAGGKLRASASTSSDFFTYGIKADKYAQNGGEVSAKAVAKAYSNAYGVSCATSFEVSKGSMKVGASCSEKGYAQGIACPGTKEIGGGTVAVSVNGETVEA